MSSKLNAAVAKGVNGGFAPGTPKKAFHNLARRVLKRIAVEVLELSKEDYDLRSNPAGVAVSGEITLHTDELYIQISESLSNRPVACVLVRTCRGRSDYTGGRNNFCPAEVLEDPVQMDEWLQRRGLITYDEDRFGREGMDRNFRPGLT